MPPPFPKRKLSITSPLSSAKKPQTHQNQNQIPTQLQFPAKWINLSCAFDSFFEAITAQFARQPRLLVNPSSHDEIIGNMSMYGNPPFETFEKCLANMIPYRLSSKVQFLDIKVQNKNRKRKKENRKKKSKKRLHFTPRQTSFLGKISTLQEYRDRCIIG